jgi:hypothetical protein
VNRLVDAVPSGSYLVINDGTDTDEAGVEGAQVRGDAGDPYCLRSPDTIAGSSTDWTCWSPVSSPPHGGDPTAAPWTTMPSWPCSVARPGIPDA